MQQSTPTTPKAEVLPSMQKHAKASSRAGESAYPKQVSAQSDNGERWPTDEAREAAIKTEGNVMQECMARYWNSNCLTDRADADAARVRMEALIAGRSPEQVQRMTAAQAERMAREPGAERDACGR